MKVEIRVEVPSEDNFVQLRIIKYYPPKGQHWLAGIYFRISSSLSIVEKNYSGPFRCNFSYKMRLLGDGYPTPTPPRCIVMQLVHSGTPRRDRESFLHVSSPFFVPCLLFARSSCRFPFHNWITRTIVHFCLNIRPRFLSPLIHNSVIARETNPESYSGFLDDRIPLETNSTTARSRIDGGPIMILNIRAGGVLNSGEPQMLNTRRFEDRRKHLAPRSVQSALSREFVRFVCVRAVNKIEISCAVITALITLLSVPELLDSFHVIRCVFTEIRVCVLMWIYHDEWSNWVCLSVIEIVNPVQHILNIYSSPAIQGYML